MSRRRPFPWPSPDTDPSSCGPPSDALRYRTPPSGGPARLLPPRERIPATPDTLFDLASNTKMFATVLALERLVSLGRLDLDRPLVSFPGWELFRDDAVLFTGAWTVGGSGGLTADHHGRADVTVRMILQHRAGLLPDPAYHSRDIAGDLWWHRADPDDRTGIVERICRTPLAAAPGTTSCYSDVGFMILGLLVEQVGGCRLDEYVREEFYDPLGLVDTTYRPLQAGVPAERLAATELEGNTRDSTVTFGHLDDGTEVPIRHATIVGEVHDEKAYACLGGVSGHAGLFATATDVVRLGGLLLAGGSVGGRDYLDPAVAREFTRPQSPDPRGADDPTIALGWRRQPPRPGRYVWFPARANPGSFGHHGWTGTLTMVDPRADLVIAVLTNLRHSPVVDPPNGFAGQAYEAMDLTAVMAEVYGSIRDR